MVTVAFDREYRNGSREASGDPDQFSPGMRVNNDGAAGGAMAGGYAPSLLAALGDFSDAGAEISIEPSGGGGGGGGSEGGFGDIGSLEGNEATQPVEGAENPTDVAERGFSGTPRALPYLKQLEQEFGISLDDVEAYTDENAGQANEKLGSTGFASGNRVAFASQDPEKSLVTHEVVHVLQQTGRDAKAAGGSGGVDTAGEAEAERVEAAVAAGRSAKAALDRDPRKAAGGKGKKQPGQRPALSSPFSSGMSFSPTGLEQSGSYRLWQGRGIGPIPIAAVPGMFMSVSPTVGVQVGGGVDWRNNTVTANVAVNGTVAAELSYGVPNVAEIYANLEAQATGRFAYERGRAPGGQAGNQGSQRPAGRRPDNWSLEGYIGLETSFNIGVKLGGGIIDKRFTIARCEIGRVTGIAWRNGTLNRNAMGFQWGPLPQRVFAQIQAEIARGQRIMRMGRDAAQQAWRNMAETGGWLYRGGGSVLSAINPFD